MSPAGPRLPRSPTLRLAGGVTSLVVCAWFGLGVVQTRDQNQARSLYQSSAHTQRDDPRVLALLRTAGVLNPDSTVELLRGGVAADQGNPSKARAIFDDIARREPRNISAWSAAARVGDGTALSHIAKLEPPVPNP